MLQDAYGPIRRGLVHGQLRRPPSTAEQHRCSPSPTCGLLYQLTGQPRAAKHPGMLLMGTARTDSRADRRRGRLRALLLRAAALPLDRPSAARCR